MRFLSTLLIFTILLFACGPSPTAEAAVDDGSLDVAEDRIMPQDQTEGTAEANPEVVDPAKLPEPQLVEKTPKTEARQTPEPQASPKPVAPPAPPAKPAPKSTRTSTPPPVPVPEPATAQEIKVTEEVVESEMEIPIRKPNHNAFDNLLKTYVNGSGRVNYAGLNEDEAKLDAYLAMLTKTPPDNWSREESFAYWLNVYNAFTLKLILKNYPVNKITDLHGGKPWDVKWVKIGEKTYSLNQIEHDIIRPRYKDPRIHFAVVCAANSCPPLANYAFTADNVNSKLEKLASDFINNEKFNQTEGDVKISKIFEWYAEDFGDVRTYLNKYLSTDIPEGTEIGYAEYDWGLNKQ